MPRTLTGFDLANISIGTRIRRRKYISYLKNKKFNNVLECGCGIGTYTVFLKTISTHLVSFDINKTIIKNAKSSNPSYKFLAADCMTMPFKDKCFDLVIAADVIEHSNNAVKALAEIARVTKNGGILVLSVPSVNCNVIYKIFSLSMHSFGHNYLFKKEDIIAILRNVDYEIVCYEKMQSFFSAFLEGLIVRICVWLYGSNIAKRNQMAIITSDNKVNAFLYFLGSMILYPAFAFCEAFPPDFLNFEHFIVSKKR